MGVSAMSEHYYTAKPTIEHQPIYFNDSLRGRTFSYMSDAGVFSRKGIDFGSRLLIETMEIPPDARVLDVGCGYGPIGLAAAALAPEGQVTMLDINERAIECSVYNAKRNHIENVRIMKSDALEQVKGERFDRILTNPPIRAGKQVVHRIFEEAAECLSDEGQLWVVIQKKQGAPSAFAKLESLFGEGNVVEAAKEKGYRILCAKRVTGRRVPLT